jgi:sugar diacid utilization regulator
MRALLVLSMLMGEGDDERSILHLATTAVHSLLDGRLEGVYLADSGWQGDDGMSVPPAAADIEAQFPVLSSAGGPLAVTGRAWGWAFPLRSVDSHVGFLVISSMTEPPADDVFLLRVLAQQTGIALSNKRLHALERGRSIELRDANASLETTVTALQRAIATHRRLTQVAVSGEGVVGIAAAVHELTGYAVTVHDVNGRLLGSAGEMGPSNSAAPGDWAALIARGQAEGRPFRNEDRIIAVISAGGEALGALSVFDPLGRAGGHETIVLEHGATVLAMELVRLRSLIEVELRLGRDVLDDLLSGTRNAQTSERAHALGFNTNAAHRVAIIVAAGATDGSKMAHIIRRMEREVGQGSLLRARTGSVVLLTDARRGWMPLIEGLHGEDSSARVRVGVGGVAEEITELPRSYHEAEMALRMFDLVDLPGPVAVFDDLGVFRLLADVRQPAAIERFIATWLGTLTNYDDNHGTDLVATLGQYLDLGGRYEATADAIAVHRSTLKYRLQRIREITGLDLKDPDVRFNLQLATRALKTLRAMGGYSAD